MKKVINTFKFLTIIAALFAISTTLSLNTFAYPTEDTPEAIGEGLYPPERLMKQKWYLLELERIQQFLSKRNEPKNTTMLIITPSDTEVSIDKSTKAKVTIITHDETTEDHATPSVSNLEDKPVNTPEVSHTTTSGNGGTTHGLRAK